MFSYVDGCITSYTLLGLCLKTFEGTSREFDKNTPEDDKNGVCFVVVSFGLERLEKFTNICQTKWELKRKHLQISGPSDNQASLRSIEPTPDYASVPSPCRHNDPGSFTRRTMTRRTSWRYWFVGGVEPAFSKIMTRSSVLLMCHAN